MVTMPDGANRDAMEASKIHKRRARVQYCFEIVPMCCGKIKL